MTVNELIKYLQAVVEEDPIKGQLEVLVYSTHSCENHLIHILYSENKNFYIGI